ncbi:hypothetical protein [Humibacter ginsenosidimutans]|nr:hypothetical protein [Humibacter ginsenosidimutans]
MSGIESSLRAGTTHAERTAASEDAHRPTACTISLDDWDLLAQHVEQER